MPTPVMEQYLSAKREHPDAVLFFRMGDFYEMFYEDAERISKVLGIALTSREKGPDAVPMAGVPARRLPWYLRKLLGLGERVAICDQVQDPKDAKGLVDRKVVRVVTAGTITEEDVLPEKEPNWLAAVVPDGDTVGLAWADVSSGDFRCAEVPRAALHDEMERMDPAEVLVPEGLEKALVEEIRRASRGPVVERPGFAFEREGARRLLCEHFRVAGLDGLGLSETALAPRAAAAVLLYLRETQRADLGHVSSIRLEARGDRMVLDRTTRRALEITETMREGSREGSLLTVLDHTLTGPGGRRLREWLLAPLLDVAAIRERQSAVKELADRGDRRETLRKALGEVHDLERLAARVATGRATPRDLDAVGRSLRALPDARAALGGAVSAPLARLHAALEPMPELATLLGAALQAPAPLVLNEGGIFRDGYDARLDELRATAREGGEAVARFQAREVERTGISNLRVGYNEVTGYYIEVTRANASKVPADYKRRQTLKSVERYLTPELAEFERRVLTAGERGRDLERELFGELRLRVARDLPALQARAAAISEADALQSLAEAGARSGCIVPDVHEGRETRVLEGRHPVLERVLGRDAFVPNDCVLPEEGPSCVILTGPNMAGKSTFIRQVALHVLMAQAGALVPAREARIGVADRIFARVGASDELARGQSTFMVEMSETAAILRAATPRSLVILDEIGRGTSTFDGVSIAWAVAEHVHDRVRCRTLFATHYHELTDLAETRPGIANWNVSVAEWGDEVVFLRKIVPGGTDRSYGIHVARLAGVPGEVVERAKELLKRLEAAGDGAAGRAAIEKGLRGRAPRASQLPLFSAPPSPLVREIAEIEVEKLTPLQALAHLAQLRDRARKDSPPGR